MDGWNLNVWCRAMERADGRKSVVSVMLCECGVRRYCKVRRPTAAQLPQEAQGAGMEECAQCGERAVDYDDQALALVCARCGHVADESQLTSRVEFDELGRAGGVRVGGGGGGGDGGEPRSWMWTAGAGGGRFGGGGWGEGAETKWGGGGKSAEFKRRKNKV
ncbi:unnamed protein product [Closterium sp. NIES-54]